MQAKNNKKELILKALAKTVKKLRGEESQFLLSAENGISISILSTIERGMKDPQLTTVFKLAEALNVEPSEFINEISKNLPQKFSFYEE